MRLPILMFHKVAPTPAGARYPGNYCAPDRFEELLVSLRRRGYEAIRIEQWLLWRAGTGQLPRKPVALTFDDGYRSNLEIAWPILQRHGFTATIFIVTDRIGGSNAWDATELQEPLLSADDIRWLQARGMSFGSHTRTHPALPRLGDAELEAELAGSRAALEAITERPVRILCYPYAKQDRRVRACAARAGYEAATRGGGGVNSRRTDPLALRRIKIDNALDLDAFHRRLTLQSLAFW